MHIDAYMVEHYNSTELPIPVASKGQRDKTWRCVD